MTYDPDYLNEAIERYMARVAPRAGSREAEQLARWRASLIERAGKAASDGAYVAVVEPPDDPPFVMASRRPLEEVAKDLLTDAHRTMYGSDA